MARVRLVVEYDMDVDGEPTVADLEREHTDWVVGNVSIEDCIGAEARPVVTVELVKDI